MGAVNETIRQQWAVVDTTHARKTGLLAANFNIDLVRDGSAASETVSFVEIGDGIYEWYFTPLSTGTYSLIVTEGAFANSAYVTHEQTFVIESAGATFSPAWTNCFCAETDVERYLGRALTATSSPTSTEAAGMAQEIADELIAVCTLAGKRYTPSAGDSPIGSTGAQGTLASILRKANALGTCWHIEGSAHLGSAPNASSRALEFYASYIREAGGVIPGTAQVIEGRITQYIRTALASGSWSSNHIASGDATAYNPTSAVEEEIPISQDEKW